MIFKKVFRLFLSLTLLLYSPYIWSQQVGAPPKASSASSRTTAFNRAPSVQATATQKFNTATDNSKNQAKKAGDSAGNGGMMAGVMGAVCAGIAAYHFAAAAAPGAAAYHIPMAILFTAGAVLGIITAMSMGKAKGQANDSANDFSPGAFPTMPGMANSPYKAGDMPPEIAAQIAKAKSALDKAGVKFDAKNGTFTTPDGKSYNAADVAAGNAGLPGGAAAFNNLMDQVKKDAEGKLAGMGGKPKDSDEELAGTGGGQKVVTLPDESTGTGGSGDNKNARDIASVDGAGKMFNGELIGVAADKIFSIVCRRTIKEVEKGKTMEGAVGRKPSDCDRYSAMSVQSKDAPIKVQTAASAPN